MDRHERISRAIARSRMDANCTPGKTIPCGKACRKPENCKQKSDAPASVASTPANQPRQFKRTAPKRASRLAQKDPSAANQVRSFERRTPEQQFRSLMKDPETAQVIELLSGKKISDKRMREATGLSQEDLIDKVARINERLGIDITRQNTRDVLKKLKKGAGYRRDSLLRRIDSLLEDLIDD